MSDSSFDLLMISAMYENGGNTTHRLLDGHPELFVYPFESQVGTSFVQDYFSSLFPAKYRWPEFRLDGEPGADYEAIIDEEMKVRTRTPHVSKFRRWPLELDDGARRRSFERRVAASGRSRAAIVAAFFEATFECWSDYKRSGRERVYVGYSPIIAVDAEKILMDLPTAHVLHVVRNPLAAYADTKKRPVPLSLAHYLTGWVTVQNQARIAQAMHPENVHIVRYEDIIDNPVATLGKVCAAIGVETSETLARPTWNNDPLDTVYPWGTIRTPTRDVNEATAAELSPDDAADVRRRAGALMDVFGY